MTALSEVLLATTPQPIGPGGATWWVYLAAGAGLGSLLAGVVAAVVTLIVGSLQRRHERRLEEERDRRALRDARLQRLRDDFRCTADITYLLDQALTPGAQLTAAEALHGAANSRLEGLRAKLELDSVGSEVAAEVTRAIQLTKNFIVDAHMVEILRTQRSHQAVQHARQSENARDRARAAVEDLRRHLRQELAEIESADGRLNLRN